MPARQLLLSHAFGDPDRIPASDAAMLVDALAQAPEFQATLVATHMSRFRGGQQIDVPVSIVFGGRDHVVPATARRPDELPAHTTWREPPALGHVPMWDDPELVAELILTP